MTTFTITGDSVVAHSATPAQAPDDTIIVASEPDLLASSLSKARLVALWNGLPGTTAVQTFRDRGLAGRRLWAAFQALPGAVAAESGAGDTKLGRMIALLRRPGGATLDEIGAVTGWQRHSIRGAISGTLKKRHGLAVASEKDETGRHYRIVEAG